MTDAAPVSRRDLRIFATIVATGFTLIGAVSFYRHRAEATHLFAWTCWWIAAGLVALALVAPSWLRPFHRGWVALGHVLGFINTRIILGLTFFGMFAPFGWASRRVFGRDPLQLARSPKTYWTRRDRSAGDHKRLY